MTSVTLTFHLFFSLPVVYKWEPTGEFLTSSLLTCIGFLVFQTVMGMLFVHVSGVHEQLHFANEENVKLLNGMHEGLIILSKQPSVEVSQSTLMFHNKPAKKLISTFFGQMGGFA